MRPRRVTCRHTGFGSSTERAVRMKRQRDFLSGRSERNEMNEKPTLLLHDDEMGR